MKKSFWYESWDQGGHKTSFHKPDVHPYILKHLPPSKLSGKRILVPLCGKSVDLMYFREYADHVIGVEFISAAVSQFFEEQKLPYSQVGNTYFGEKITMINSDFFEVLKADVGHIDLVYDRACLVALPLNLRIKYIEKVEELLPVHSQQFINTLEYFSTKSEPPFSINPEEVKNYYGHSHNIEHVEDQTVENHGLKRAWGLSWIKEHGFILTKRKRVHKKTASKMAYAASQASHI